MILMEHEAELDRKEQIEKRDRPGFSRGGGEGPGKGTTESLPTVSGATGLYIVWAILVYGGLA